MAEKSLSIVLRTTSYGETSLISTQFVRESGLESFLHKGVKKSRSRQASLLQTGQVLDLVIVRRPPRQWAQIKEMAAHKVWIDIPTRMIKSSLVLFSAEFMLRLLPPQAPMTALFDLHLRLLDIIEESPSSSLANLPLYLLKESCEILGIGIQGRYSKSSPYLNLEEGRFDAQGGSFHPGWDEAEDLPLLSLILESDSWESIRDLPSRGRQRQRLLEGWIAYLSYHSEHMGKIRSLDILRQLWKGKED